jgi:hypothetical protein
MGMFCTRKSRTLAVGNDQCHTIPVLQLLVNQRLQGCAIA